MKPTGELRIRVEDPSAVFGERIRIHDESLRMQALDSATRIAKPHWDTRDVLVTARDFEDYLRGTEDN